MSAKFQHRIARLEGLSISTYPDCNQIVDCRSKMQMEFLPVITTATLETAMSKNYTACKME